MNSIIVSYFSDVDGRTYYSDHGRRLNQELSNLGDDFVIARLNGTGNYRLNCLSKPKFLQTMFENQKRDMIWLDVDSLVHKSLSMFDPLFEKAHLICTSHLAQGQPPNPGYVTKMKASPLGIKYCDEMREFLNEWVSDCENEMKNPNQKRKRFDHEVLLETTLPKFYNKLRFALLDNRWCTWPGYTNENTYITMGIADTTSKEQALIDMGISGDLLTQQLIGNNLMERDYENSSSGKPI